MTIVQPPTYIAAGCYTAQQFRALQDSAAGHQPNVVTGLTLTTVSGRDLTFAAGSAVVEGASVAEGYYQVLVSAAETVTVGVGDPTNPRIDRVVVRVETTEFGDATDTGSIEVVAGTPAASPVAPTPSFSRYLTLATVYVAAGATTLTSANVTQLQINNRNVSLCTSAGRPSAPTKGQPIYETDTDKLLQYQTATTGWTPPWNLPWGVVGTGSNTTSATITTTQATISGLSTTITLVANRRYKATVTVPVLKNTSSSVVSIQTFVGATGIGGTSATVASGSYATLTGSHLFTGSGSTLITAAGSVVSDTASLNVSGVFPATLIIEDVGPAAAPA